MIQPVYIVNFLMLLINIFYVFNRNIVKPKLLVEFVYNKVSKLVFMFSMYLLALHYDFTFALQLVIAFFALEFDVQVAINKAVQS